MSTTTHHPHLILHPYPLTLLTSPTNPNTTGLLTGIELEITNIIPQDENAEIILRNLRDVNADHAVVGWYTTRAQGATTNKAGNTWGSAEDVEILEKYQTEMEGGGVCIVYGRSYPLHQEMEIRHTNGKYRPGNVGRYKSYLIKGIQTHTTVHRILPKQKIHI